MKKRLFYLFALIASMTIVSCGSDNKDDKKDETAGDYAGTYTGNNLDLNVGGVSMSDYSASISSAGVLTLTNVVPGDATMNVTLACTNGVLTGTGTASTGSVSVQGKVEDSKLTMTVDITMSNSLIGTWSPMPFTSDSDGNITSNPIYVTATPEDATVTFIGQQMPMSMMSSFIEAVVGAYAQQLLSVTFEADGFLTASYISMGGEIKTTDKGLVRYYVKGSMIYIIPNVSAMMTRATSIDDLLGMLNEITVNGLPLMFDTTSGLKVWVTKDMMLPYVKIIDETLLPMLPEENELVVMLKTVLPEFITILETATQFDMGIELKK